MQKYCFIIPFHNPYQWHTDYANQTARILARRHIVVCFLWGDAVSLREIIVDRKPYRMITKDGNHWRYQPLYVVPGKRFAIVQAINLILNAIIVQFLCSIIIKRITAKRVFWFFGFFHPVFACFPYVFWNMPILYDCVDRVWHPLPRIAATLQNEERKLLKRAWIVTANSHTLTALLRKTRAVVHTVPLGFRIEMFRHPKPLNGLLTTTKPMIGFIGAIDYRLDYRLISRVIRDNPQWQFALIGPIFDNDIFDYEAAYVRRMTGRLLSLPNVVHTAVSPRYVPTILNRCAATIIPYNTRLPFNRYAFPMKCMEYFYAQKYVITTPIMELSRYAPFVRQGTTPKEWTRHIAHTLTHPLTPSQRRQERTIALSHTWEKKIEAILDVMKKREYEGFTGKEYR